MRSAFSPTWQHQRRMEAMTARNTKADDHRSGPERRCHLRYAIKGATVEYVKVEFLAFTDKSRWRKDGLGNVSEGGMLFLSEQDFAAGQNLSLCLDIQGHKRSLKMRGAVIWTQPAKGGKGCEVGVKFGMCSAEAAETLAGLARECEAAPDKVTLYVKSE